jgi:hypothetical protein
MSYSASPALDARSKKLEVSTRSQQQNMISKNRNQNTDEQPSKANRATDEKANRASDEKANRATDATTTQTSTAQTDQCNKGRRKGEPSNATRADDKNEPDRARKVL